jgi:DNA-binding XRE family transcriptional regulator
VKYVAVVTEQMRELIRQLNDLHTKNQDDIRFRFGANVKRRREDLRLTQEYVATILGLSRPAVANIEAGKQNTLLHHAVLIAMALDCSLDSLCGSGSAD